MTNEAVQQVVGKHCGVAGSRHGAAWRSLGPALGVGIGQVADLAVEAASRIVTSSMTPEAQKKLVKEFIDGLPKAPS